MFFFWFSLSKKVKTRQLLPLIFFFAEVLLVAKTSLWEGQYGTMRSDLELPGTFRFFAFLLLILFDGPWLGKACSEFEKDFHIFPRVLTCSRIFSQRKNFSSKKIRSLSENIWICIFHCLFCWKMSKVYFICIDISWGTRRLEIYVKCYLSTISDFFLKLLQNVSKNLT